MVRTLSRIAAGGLSRKTGHRGDNRKLGCGIGLMTAALTCVIVLITAPTASADPPNMMPIPGQIPKDINRAVPLPPIPKLTAIPARSRTPELNFAMQELREATMPSPTGDPLFDRWPTDLAALQPGTIIAQRNVTATAAPIVTAPIISARLLKFRSTDATGQPSWGTATILVPNRPHRGPRPILVNNLPTDSLGSKCTAGYTMAHGFSLITSGKTDLFPPTTQLALARGYSVLVPDHEGPRMAYGEPTVAAHVILDAIRAITNLDPQTFGQSRIAMTGYSGGAIATNGATKLVGSYAPELASRIVGAAMGGVPADFRMLVGSMNANLGTGLFHAATFGISRERPEIIPMANNLARWLATSPLKDICSTPSSVGGVSMFPMQLLSSDPDPFHSPVAENIYRITKMTDVKSVVPLYIYQGTYEWWIPAAGARNLFGEQCRMGTNATYQDIPGEHLTTAVFGFPGALQWLDQRLQGVPPRNGCPR